MRANKFMMTDMNSWPDRWRRSADPGRSSSTPLRYLAFCLAVRPCQYHVPPLPPLFTMCGKDLATR